MQSQIVAHRAAGLDGHALAAAPPTANTLLKTIGAYIPADVSALYVPIAAAMVIAEVSDTRKERITAGVAVLAAFAVWVVGHRAAVQLAREQAKPIPSARDTLRAGWYEILAAPVAFAIWALAIPDNLVDWGKDEAWAPAALVGGASIVIGGLAVLLNRPNAP